MLCPKCNTENPEENRFCGFCGTALSPEMIEFTKNTDVSETEELLALLDAESPIPVKKKHPLRLPAILLAVMFLIGSILFILFPSHERGPASYTQGYFTLTDGVLYFDSNLYSGEATIEVPETIAGHAVTVISEGCFAKCPNIETIILPETVTEIGREAFYGCLSLRGIAIPESVNTIGEKAFAKCRELESIVVPASVRSIGIGCFADCDSLHYIFYSNTYDEWKTLYSDFISFFTFVSCSDGIFAQ